LVLCFVLFGADFVESLPLFRSTQQSLAYTEITDRLVHNIGLFDVISPGALVAHSSITPQNQPGDGMSLLAADAGSSLHSGSHNFNRYAVDPEVVKDEIKIMEETMDHTDKDEEQDKVILFLADQLASIHSQDILKGDTGPRGVQGVRGVEGQKGNPGLQGPVGPPGHAGPAGIMGELGQHGPQGDPGPRGKDGKNGATGFVGQAGVRGPRGVAGAQGLTGPTGEAGLSGVRGKRGVMGPRGPAGPPGLGGLAGRNGRDGRDGVAGDPGKPGQDGKNGPPGPDGKHGADGVNGLDGTSGTQGKTLIITDEGSVLEFSKDGQHKLVEFSSDQFSSDQLCCDGDDGVQIDAEMIAKAKGLVVVDLQPPPFVQVNVSDTSGNQVIPSPSLQQQVTITGTGFDSVKTVDYSIDVDAIGCTGADNTNVHPSQHISPTELILTVDLRGCHGLLNVTLDYKGQGPLSPVAVATLPTPEAEEEPSPGTTTLTSSDTTDTLYDGGAMVQPPNLPLIPGLCTGVCGGMSGGCSCTSGCEDTDSCCPDYRQRCLSCASNCHALPTTGRECQCHDKCQEENTCCEDFTLYCSA